MGMVTNKMPDLQFAVGMSKRLDPTEAGHEAASKAITQLKGEPKFMLIFCTIHYDKEKDGLKKLVKACRGLIKEEVPSIGGTVTGFICPEGCHTRGIVVVVGQGNNIDVAASYKKNVTRNPNLSGKELGRIINKSLRDSRKRNNLLIDIMQGPIEPKWYASMINSSLFRGFYSKLPNNIAFFLRDIFTKIYLSIIPGGSGKEEEILNAITKELDDNYYLVGCSTFDDLKILRHYQWYNDQVLAWSTVVLRLSVDNKIILERRLPLIPTGTTFKVKRGWDNRSIDLIDGCPATTRYIEMMGWPIDFIKPHIRQLFQETFYYPLGFRENNQINAFPAGFFFGESIMQNRIIRKDEIELFMTSAKKTVEEVKDILRPLKNNYTNFTFLVKSGEVIGIMGENIKLIKRELDEVVGDSPYLVIFGSGEHSKTPNEKVVFNDFSIVMLSILK